MTKKIREMSGKWFKSSVLCFCEKGCKWDDYSNVSIDKHYLSKMKRTIEKLCDVVDTIKMNQNMAMYEANKALKQWEDGL